MTARIVFIVLVALQSLMQCSCAVAQSPTLVPPLSSIPESTPSGRQVALVIANSTYANSAIANAIDQALTITDALKERGLEVKLQVDRNKVEMESDIDEIIDGLSPEDTVLVYFIGHGIRTTDGSCLVPVDATLNGQLDIRKECVSLDYLVSAMAYSKANQRIVVLDACRHNSFQERTSPNLNGLGAVALTDGITIAYSAAADTFATDAPSGASGFSQEFAAALESQPTVSIESVLSSVGESIRKRTGHSPYLSKGSVVATSAEPTQPVPNVLPGVSILEMSPSVTSPTSILENAQQADADIILRQAELGVIDAQLQLARMYSKGTSVNRNPHEAMKWFRAAAIQGSAEAQVELGDAYLNGLEQNDTEAFTWYQKAAEQGSSQAYTALGKMYMYGRGVARDTALAMHWFREAAKQSNAEAMHYLGLMHLGIGSEVMNADEGEDWLRKAAGLGFQDSADTLENRMRMSDRRQPQPYVATTPSSLDKTLQHPVGMQFALIPAGRFSMGSLPTDEFRNIDEEPRDVTISSPFYMSVHEITVGQYRKFVDATGYRTLAEKNGYGYTEIVASQGHSVRTVQGQSWRYPGYPVTDDHPATQLTWDDALVFANWLSMVDKQRRYRLPTEAEWEYAARGGTSTTFATGNHFQSLRGYANLSDDDQFDRFSFASPAGSFQPNNFGLFDMHGNVWEWCLDSYDPNITTQAAIDPLSRLSTDQRILRGGSFLQPQSFQRVANRGHSHISSYSQNLGFRVVHQVATSSSGTPVNQPYPYFASKPSPQAHRQRPCHVRVTAESASATLHLRNLVRTSKNGSTLKLNLGDHDLEETTLASNSSEFFNGEVWLGIHAASTSPNDVLEFYTRNNRWFVRVVPYANVKESWAMGGRVAAATVPVKPRVAPTPAPTPAPRPAPKPAPVPIASWQQSWNAVSQYIRENEMSVCHLKGLDPGYSRIIQGLSDQQKHWNGLFHVCFPSEATWNSRPDVAAEMVATLRRMRIL